VSVYSVPLGSMNRGWEYYDTVRGDVAGQTVLDYYTRRYRHSSREQWLRRIEDGYVTLDGSTVSADQVLRGGETLCYHRPPWEEPSAPLTYDVLHADDHILVVNKPSGLPVLPGGGFLAHTLLHLVRRDYGDGASPLHRLGRGTSGVVLFSRTVESAKRLSALFRNRRVEKTYLAVVSGDMPDTLEITTPIGRVSHPLLGDVFAAHPGGKPSRSRCRVLERDARRNLALVEVVIETGRPHQIRIHLSAAGFPLLGDPLYGPGGLPRVDASSTETASLPGDCGYFLHALRLSFIHPVARTAVSFACPPPWSFPPTGPA